MKSRIQNRESILRNGKRVRVPEPADPSQLALFSKAPPPPRASPIEEALRAIEVNGLTPIQAMAKLAELVEQSKKAAR